MSKDCILSYIDHTNLSPSATWADIRTLCDEGALFNTASVCIPPSFVKRAAQYKPELNICTVIGFPNGYATTQSKLSEAEDALRNGANELDTVINIGAVKDGDFTAVESELSLLKALCGDKILKVIIEACLLTQQEKIKMCEIITKVKADYIKTSTGFSKGGATKDDILLFKKHIGSGVKIKAAGGIRTLEDAEEYIKLGCSRLGSSVIVALIKAKPEVKN